MSSNENHRRHYQRFAGINILGDVPNKILGFQFGLIEGETSRRTISFPQNDHSCGLIIEHLRCADRVAVLTGDEGAYFAHVLSQSAHPLGVHVGMITPKAFAYYLDEIPREPDDDIPHRLAKLLAQDHEQRTREESIFRWLGTSPVSQE